MNKKRIIKSAEIFFDNVLKINDDLFKAELNFGENSPAGIYYLDFNTALTKLDFNIYQEKLLAKEFFKNRGNLQWNHYLLLLQDQIDPQKKREIELNDQFARKYVFNEDEFIHFFNIDRSEGELKQNVVQDWKTRLDKVNLSELYSKVPMTKAVERFYKDSTIKPIKPDFLQGNVDVEISTIDKIILTDKYREFPKSIREFSFGKVNLISGINGVGKTSLFESIELLLCGKTLNNQNKTEEIGCISGFFNKTKKKYNLVTKNSKLYKERDLVWYANTNSRGNNLEISFNRYNFFNSDAAYTFSRSDDEGSIKSALYNLVLGPEYNYLKDRIEKAFSNHLRPEYNKIQKEYLNFKKKFIDSKNQIEALKKSGSLDKISDVIIKNVKESGIKFNIKDLENDYSELELIIGKVSSTISAIEQLSKEPISKSIAEEYSESIIKKSDRLEKFKLLLKTKLENKKTLNTKKVNLIEIKLLLEQSLKYFKDKKLFEIKGFESKVRKNKNLLGLIKKISSKTDDVDFKAIESNQTISDFTHANTKKLLKNKNDLERITSSINKILKSLGELEKITKEIKRLGENYLELTINAESCPLCYSKYKPEELSIRIKKTYEDQDIELSTKLTELNKRQKELLIVKEQLNKTNYVLELFTDCLDTLIYDSDMVSQNSITQNLQTLQLKLDTIDTLNMERRELNRLQTLFQKYDISESEFELIESKLQKRFPDNIFSYENKNNFIALNDKNNAEIIDTDEEIETVINEISSLTASFIKTENLNFEHEPDLNYLSEEYNVQSNNYERIIGLYKKIEGDIKIETNTKSNETLLFLNIISKNIDQYKTELRNKLQLTVAKEQKSLAEDFINKNKNKKRRLKEAKNEIEKILSKIKSNDHLTEFFNENLNEIFDIFKSIHVPKEFTKMRFKEGKLILYDVKNSQRTVSEISTGQRSALALSIFLCLNRKLRHGPNIIMFDDPVSFIDDFNALSFLDFLRYFLLKENKQIFFATANVKLASFFKKKFSFLDKKFKHWELSR